MKNKKFPLVLGGIALVIVVVAVAAVGNGGLLQGNLAGSKLSSSQNNNVITRSVGTLTTSNQGVIDTSHDMYRPPISLSKPVDGATNVPLKDTAAGPTFNWEKGYTFYTVQYTDDNFPGIDNGHPESGYTYHTGASNTATIPAILPNGLKPNTKYYWRVKGQKDDYISDWSKVFSFTTAAQ